MTTITTLSYVDISKLTQSELYSLSLLSLPPSSTTNTVSPTLSPLTFNESSASRPQTFSRALRRPPSSTANHHPPRTPHHSPPPPQPSSLQPQNDPDSNQNKSIIFFLKNLLKASNLYNPDDEIANVSLPISRLSGLRANDASFVGINIRKRTESKNEDGKIVTFAQLRDKDVAFVSGASKKRKRAGREKESASVNIVNKNGVVVNLEALSKLVDPFGEELRRRTTGLVGEEECLKFLKGLEGRWGSTRKKRKIVSACEFGDAFPVGWKLILGLRRKEGRIWVYIRRYISPTGQPFISCKQVASFLKSYFGHCNLIQAATPIIQSVLSPGEVSGSHAGLTFKDGNPGYNLSSNTSLSRSSISNDTEDALFGIANLSEVQVRDLFECYRCNLSFDEKEIYLQHLMSSHSKTTRRYRLDSSVGDGVIVNDGKYECQFCHKIFEEKRKYNSHVGVHVRGNSGKSECHPAVVAVDDQKIESSSKDVKQTEFSKMDALIRIAQNSMMEASKEVNNGKLNNNSAHNGLNVALTPVTYGISNFEYEPETHFPVSKPEMEDDTSRDQHKALNNNQSLPSKEIVRCDNTMSNMNLSITTASGTINPMADLAFSYDDNKEAGVEEHGGSGSCLDTLHSETKALDLETDLSSSHAEIMVPQKEEIHNSINGDAEISFKISDTEHIVDGPDGNMKPILEENIVHPEVVFSSVATGKLLHCFPLLGSVSVEGVDELSSVRQKRENVTSFEELKLDGIEPFRFSFLTEEDSAPLPELSMEMETSNQGVKRGFDSSVGFGSGTEEGMSCLSGAHQVISVCVWCSMEFSHVALDSEIQSDSVGYMCPTCKAKISGQLNVFDNHLSMNPNHF